MTMALIVILLTGFNAFTSNRYFSCFKLGTISDDLFFFFTAAGASGKCVDEYVPILLVFCVQTAEKCCFTS